VQSFMIALLVCTVVMSAVAALYMLFAQLFSRRYSAKWQYYIWLIIIIGFIIPFRPSLGNDVVIWEIPAPSAPIVMFYAETIEQRVEAERIATEAQAGVESRNVFWWQLAFLAWLVGAAVFLVYHIVRHLIFIKAVGRWSEEVTDSRVLAAFEGIKTEMGIKERVSLHISPFGSPMAIGIIKPKIFLPRADMEQSELRFILSHELTHCKRKDLIYKYLVVFATALHWFNPVIHMVARVIDMLCEVSCDAEVVHGTDACTRQSYGEALIGVVAYQTKIKTALSTNFYKGKKGIESRISSILDTRKKKSGLLVTCAVMLLVASTSVFAVAPQVDAELASMVSQDDSYGWHIEFGGTLVSVFQAGATHFDGFRITEVDHGQVWDAVSDMQVKLFASLPIHNVSLIRFTIAHDYLLGEDAFIRTVRFNVADTLDTGEVLLLNNFTSPYLFNIISFYDMMGQQHFLAISHNAYYYPYFFSAFELTKQVIIN